MLHPRSFLGLQYDDAALASQAIKQPSDLDAARYLLLAGQHQAAAHRLLAAATKLFSDSIAANPTHPIVAPSPPQAASAAAEYLSAASPAGSVGGRSQGIPAVNLTPELQLLAYALNSLSPSSIQPDTWAQVFTAAVYLGCLGALRYGYLTVAAFLAGTCARWVDEHTTRKGTCAGGQVGLHRLQNDRHSSS